MKISPAHTETTISALFTSPKNTFKTLKTSPGIKRPLILTLTTLPLLPLLIALHFHTNLQREFQANPDMDINLASSMTIATITGTLFLFSQVFLLLVHYLTFMLLIKIFGAYHNNTVAKTVWWYALTPLMFRQIFYFIFLMVWGVPHLKDVSIVGYIDPFIIWSATLIYLGCRNTLGANRKISFTVAFLSSIVGLLGPLAQFVGLG